MVFVKPAKRVFGSLSHCVYEAVPKGSAMGKNTLAASRKSMLQSISAKTGHKPVTVKVQMDDQEVPTFLQQLEEFETKSRKRSIMIS